MTRNLLNLVAMISALLLLPLASRAMASEHPGLAGWHADSDKRSIVERGTRHGPTDATSAADGTAFLANHGAASASWGRGVLSNRENILGYAGYVHEPATGSAGGGHGTMWHCRMRVHHAGLGRWIQRDPPEFEYGEGMSVLWYAASNPVRMLDAMGTACAPIPPGCCSTDTIGINADTRCIYYCALRGGLGVTLPCEPGGPLCCLCLENIKNIYSPPSTSPSIGPSGLDILAICTHEHESCHVAQGCPAPPNPNCREVPCYQAELACLYNQMLFCESSECLFIVLRRIAEVQENLALAQWACTLTSGPTFRPPRR